MSKTLIINVPSSTIHRSFHTIFVKNRVFDIFLKYNHYRSVDERLLIIIYNDICCNAIEQYTRQKFGINYTDYDPEIYDIILHKALTRNLKEYLTNRNLDIFSARMSSDLIYKFQSFDIIDRPDYEYYAISQYIADYIILSKLMNIKCTNYIDAITNVYYVIMIYIREYNNLILHNSIIRYHLCITNGKINVQYNTNQTAIRVIERYTATETSMANIIAANLLGIRCVDVSRPSLSDSTKTELYKLRNTLYRCERNRVTDKILRTIHGRSLRFAEMVTSLIPNNIPEPQYIDHAFIIDCEFYQPAIADFISRLLYYRVLCMQLIMLNDYLPQAADKYNDLPTIIKLAHIDTYTPAIIQNNSIARELFKSLYWNQMTADAVIDELKRFIRYMFDVSNSHQQMIHSLNKVLSKMFMNDRCLFNKTMEKAYVDAGSETFNIKHVKYYRVGLKFFNLDDIFDIRLNRVLQTFVNDYKQNATDIARTLFNYPSDILPDPRVFDNMRF